MTQTKRPAKQKARKRIVLCALLLSMLCGYILLVAGDLALGLVVERANEQIEKRAAPYEKIKSDRLEETDKQLVIEAMGKGLMPMFRPWNVEHEKRYIALANRLGVAPLASHTNSPLFYCNEGYGLIAYQSDRFGMRNDDSIWDTPEIDVAMIGDSYINGACVPRQGTITSQFMELTGQTSLSLGSGGNGPMVYAALAKTFVPMIKPKYVVMSFFPNDNLDELNSPYWDIYFKHPGASIDYFAPTEAGKRPKGVAPEIMQFYEQALEIMFTPPDPSDNKIQTPAPNHFSLSVIRSSVRGLWSRYVGDPPTSTMLAINTLIETCKAVGCTPVFMYLPNSEYWSPDARADTYLASLSRYLDRHTEHTLLDMSEPVAELGMSAFAPQGNHYSPQGYGLVARLLGDYIQTLQHKTPAIDLD